MGDWTYADVFETVAVCLPDESALIHGEIRRTWADLDRRADGLAQFLLNTGAQHQTKIAFYLYNRPEYLELFYACSKISLVHVNTNYRYADDELVYIWEDADATHVVFQGFLTETAGRIRRRLPKVTHWIWVDDGYGTCPEWATAFEDAAATPNVGLVRGPWGRSGDDLLLLYTGGTTGMPKGVMWRQSDLFAVNDRMNGTPLPDRSDLDQDGLSPAVRARTRRVGPVSLPACPLMHGGGLFNSLNTLTLGGSIVTLTQLNFDVTELLDCIQKERVKSIFIVGDAFAKPIQRALDSDPTRWDISSLKFIISGGVMWSSATKEGLLRHNPNIVMIDGFGATEAIGVGSSVSKKGDLARTASFKLGANAVVIDDDGRLVVPGSDRIGRVGISGPTAIGYYKDPEKSALTFPIVNGIRYSIPGDFATVEADGSISLLGRGSVCINTGGEKVFPEEVEEVLKLHPAVADAVAVGVPDDRFGQVVTAIVETVAGETFSEKEVIDHVKTRLASYKAPKRILVVDALERAANGKVDYQRWTTHASLHSS